MRSKKDSIIQNAKIQGTALFFAYQDRQTPWLAKLVSILVLVQIFNPIDLIPDFIPFVGYLDDLILIPAGLWLAWKLIPSEIRQRSFESAQLLVESNPTIPRRYKLIIASISVLFVIIVIVVLVFLFNPGRTK